MSSPQGGPELLPAPAPWTAPVDTWAGAAATPVCLWGPTKKPDWFSALAGRKCSSCSDPAPTPAGREEMVEGWGGRFPAERALLAPGDAHAHQMSCFPWSPHVQMGLGCQLWPQGTSTSSS